MHFPLQTEHDQDLIQFWKFILPEDFFVIFYVTVRLLCTLCATYGPMSYPFQTAEQEAKRTLAAANARAALAPLPPNASEEEIKRWIKRGPVQCRYRHIKVPKYRCGF